MLIDQIVKPLAHIAYGQVLRREKHLGYKLEIHQDPRHWIPGTMIFDMTPVWKKFGLDAVGVNYFTIGGIKNDISTRFDANSPYYQSWLGGYIARFPSGTVWDIKDCVKLAEADQISWLKTCGAPHPTVISDYDHIENLGKINVNRYKGILYMGRVKSNTDVGAANTNPYKKLLWGGAAYFFNRSDQNSHISFNHFLPHWSPNERLGSYEIIHLDVLTAILTINRYTKAIIYGNGVRFTDKAGRKADTFKKIRAEILETFHKMKIIKL